MKKILVFGNPYLKEDNLAFKIAKKLDLQGAEIEHCANPDDLLNHDLKNTVILDVAKGIDKVRVFENVDELDFSSIFSLHDFDLGFFLKLLKEADSLEKVRIIAVPQDYDEEKAYLEVSSLLETFSNIEQ